MGQEFEFIHCQNQCKLLQKYLDFNSKISNAFIISPDILYNKPKTICIFYCSVLYHFYIILPLPELELLPFVMSHHNKLLSQFELGIDVFFWVQRIDRIVTLLNSTSRQRRQNSRLSIKHEFSSTVYVHRINIHNNVLLMIQVFNCY